MGKTARSTRKPGPAAPGKAVRMSEREKAERVVSRSGWVRCSYGHCHIYEKCVLAVQSGESLPQTQPPMCFLSHCNSCGRGYMHEKCVQKLSSDAVSLIAGVKRSGRKSHVDETAVFGPRRVDDLLRNFSAVMKCSECEGTGRFRPVVEAVSGDGFLPVKGDDDTAYEVQQKTQAAILVRSPPAAPAAPPSAAPPPAALPPAAPPPTAPPPAAARARARAVAPDRKVPKGSDSISKGHSDGDREVHVHTLLHDILRQEQMLHESKKVIDEVIGEAVTDLAIDVASEVIVRDMAERAMESAKLAQDMAKIAVETVESVKLRQEGSCSTQSSSRFCSYILDDYEKGEELESILRRLQFDSFESFESEW